MTFNQAIQYLYSFVSYEKKTHWTYSDKTLNLDRFRDFLGFLGNPQDGFQSIHVAGSDGKGSVCAMVASVLRNMGYRVGVFSSPHLHNVRERITINGEWISESDFARWAEHLQKATEQRTPLPKGYVTFFELITAMAFLHFQEEKVDFAVVETGLGGRLDTTNVMNPKVTTITHISLEHTEQLGNTLEAIADEKLGITRPNAPVIIGHQEKTLLPHFRNRLEKHSSSVILVDEHYEILSNHRGVKYRTLEIGHIGQDDSARRVRIPLFGHYQLQNTMTAMATIDSLAQSGVIPLPSRSQLDRGFGKVVWPGRFEIIRRAKQPITVLDVAHTAKGAASLRLSLDEQFPRQKRVYVIGFLQGKKFKEMLQSLVRPDDVFFFTQAPTPRGASLDTIRKIIAELEPFQQEVHYIQNPLQALESAKAICSRKHLLCITGSLYLVGEIRSNILGEISV